jgi:hypothetical protein
MHENSTFNIEKESVKFEFDKREKFHYRHYVTALA